MTGRELIEEINKHRNIDLPITISVDIGEEERVFTGGFLESLNFGSYSEITLLFEGESNT